jgi:hypothetical protein
MENLLRNTGLLHKLINDGLLDEDLEITPKGMKIANERPRKVSVKELVDKYRDLFPKGVKSGGYRVKGSKQGCLKKMEKFVKEHPEYSFDLILEATQQYIERKRAEGWRYMNLSHFFIEKNGVSQLEAECEALSDDSERRQDYSKTI